MTDQNDIDQLVELTKRIGLTNIAPSIDFRGQTVLITGGADGMGAAAVKAMHRFGAHIIALDVQAEKLAALKAELGDERITTIPFDLSQSDDEAYEELGKTILDGSPSGKIDAYMMHAGVVKMTDITVHNTVANTPMSEFYKMAQINAFSHAAIYQQIRPALTDNARIVLTTSPIVGRAAPSTAAYSVTKRMLEDIANNIAAELKDTNIKVQGFVPPPVQNFLRKDLKPNEPVHAHPEGIDIVELPLRLAAPDVKGEFNGKVVAYGYDHLRKSDVNSAGEKYDYMPRDPSDNGFVYDLRERYISRGVGDLGDTIMLDYSTHAMRAFMGAGRTPDMIVDQKIDDVYQAPEHIASARRPKP